MSDLPIISLFTGGGGLDGGLEAVGFKVRVAVEPDPTRVKTIKLNKPRWRVVPKRIERVSTEELLSIADLKVGEAALVTAGSPCQPFSKSALWRGVRSDDPRANLVLEFVRVVSEAKPLGLIFENVPGLAGKLGGQLLQLALRRLRKAGYRCRVRKLNAADYGVPQKRQRVFVLGIRKELQVRISFPMRTHGPKARRPWVTAGQAIRELDDGTVHEHEVVGGKWGHLLKLIPPGGNYLWLTERGGGPPIFRWRSRYWTFLLKLHPDLPSWTIQARPGPYTGPFHWNNRRLRIPEVRRLQTFPDSWRLAGTSRQQWAQLGDATPYWLAIRIGLCMLRALARAGYTSLDGGPGRLVDIARRELPWLAPYIL